jgi:hypothetical protein
MSGPYTETFAVISTPFQLTLNPLHSRNPFYAHARLSDPDPLAKPFGGD